MVRKEYKYGEISNDYHSTNFCGRKFTTIAPGKFLYDFTCYKKLNIGEVVFITPVEVLGKSCFQGCDVSKVNLNDGLVMVDDNAFKDCFALQEICLPDSVEFLGNNIFKNCYNLKKIYISPNVKEFGENLFENCLYIESFVCGASMKNVALELVKKVKTLKSATIVDKNGNELEVLQKPRAKSKAITKSFSCELIAER